MYLKSIKYIHSSSIYGFIFNVYSQNYIYIYIWEVLK